jgi:hypothetical protein
VRATNAEEAIESGKEDTRNHHAEEMHQRFTRCIVCSLEAAQYKRLSKDRSNEMDEFTKKIIDDSYKSVRRSVHKCSECGVTAHNFRLARDRRFIHGLFEGMSCMEIVHSETGQEIWNVDKTGEKRISVNYQHPIVKQVREAVKEHLGYNSS